MPRASCAVGTTPEIAKTKCVQDEARIRIVQRERTGKPSPRSPARREDVAPQQGDCRHEGRAPGFFHERPAGRQSAGQPIEAELMQTIPARVRQPGGSAYTGSPALLARGDARLDERARPLGAAAPHRR